MAKYALIVDDYDPAGNHAKLIREIWDEKPLLPETMDLRDISTHPDAEIGWIAGIAGNVYPYVEPPATKEELIKYSNAAQMIKALGGLAVKIGDEFVPFSTESTSMAFMNGLVTDQLLPDPPASVNWQIGATEFKVIAAADFMAAARTVKNFVQATFDALPAIFLSIASGTITTTAEIDAVFDAM